MERYKCVIDELLAVIGGEKQAHGENRTLKSRDMKLLEEAVDDKGTDTEKIMLMVRDLLDACEGAAYLEGVAAGMKLK